MQKVNNILNQVPSWIVTVCVALVVSYSTIQLKVNTLETRNSVMQERINQLDETKANKELFQESTSRLDRIEGKLDRLIENKQNK
jgi:cell division protein FtsL